MPCLIPGYAYDIFISYRHNDNRSGWVTDFVQALQEELAATIKESVSVYFDTNPHDGLLETHNVDKSLEKKLKCLIFIPIISQTYCDRKSFAWQHEFCAFNKMAKKDQFGRDITLSNCHRPYIFVFVQREKYGFGNDRRPAWSRNHSGGKRAKITPISCSSGYHEYGISRE